MGYLQERIRERPIARGKVPEIPATISGEGSKPHKVLGRYELGLHIASGIDADHERIVKAFAD